MKQKQTLVIVAALALIVLLVIVFNLNACSNASTPAPATTEAGQEATPSAAEVKASVLSNVNLRSGPGPNYSVVGDVPAGSEVTVIGAE